MAQMVAQYLVYWTNAECNELISVLHRGAGDVDRDMSDLLEVRLIVEEIQTCLASFTPIQHRRSPGEILAKIRNFIREYHNFVAFISKPEIIYDVETNRVSLQGMYDMERETPAETKFRLDGFEHYCAMKEVSEGSAIEAVRWGEVLPKLNSGGVV